jgi:RNA recognition motif-containing protein
MNSNYEATFCCWVGNIPGNIDNDLIEKYFENEAKYFDSFHSINVEYNKKHNSYQCYLNFLNENSMKNSAIYFNGKNYCDQILQAEERKSKRMFSISSPNSLPKTNQIYSANIAIARSKHIPKTKHMKTRDQSRPAKSKHFVVAFTDVLYANCIYGNSLSQSSICSYAKDVSAALLVRSSLSDYPLHFGWYGVVLSRSISKSSNNSLTRTDW